MSTSARIGRLDRVPIRMTTTPTDPNDPRVTPDPPHPISPGEEPGPGAEPEPDDAGSG